MGALMLIPAAHAFAVPKTTVNVTGPGSGKVISKNVFPGPGTGIGTPPIVCTYNGVSKSGVCENTPDEPNEESGFFVSGLEAQPAPGSEFGGWKVQMGPYFEVFGEFGTTGCPGSSLLAENPGPNPPLECFFQTVEENESESGVYEALATFCDEGTAKEEEVFNTAAEANEMRLVGCEEAPAGSELTVTKEGTGSGTVVSNPAGIECGVVKCKASFETNQKVTLTASPSAGSMFTSWKGCESGGANGRQCTVTMDKAKTVIAKFTAAYDVALTKSGSGLGKVSSSPGGVLCLNNCSAITAAFKEGTSVTLSATPAKNNAFVEWTGACSGSGTCSLTMSANKTVGAKFEAVAQHSLSLTKSGGGNGTVKSSLPGISCGATCSSMAASYYQGSVVALTATPGKGTAFGGWSGGGCSGIGTCTVTMSAAKSVNAEFK
jgi:hypothetical protein